MCREFCACWNSCWLIAPACTRDSRRFTWLRQYSTSAAAGAVGFRAAHGGLLFVGVDLQHRGPGLHAISRLDEDARDDAIDLGLDGAGAKRAERRDELRRLLDGLLGKVRYPDRRRAARPAAAATSRAGRGLSAAVACGTADANKEDKGVTQRSSGLADVQEA